MKVRLTISYQGTHFYGWQRQKNARTVQGELEKALFRLFRRPVSLTGSGRTDTGVHALGQTAHFEIPPVRPRPLNLVKALNHLTPSDISLHGAWGAPEEFHARFSAQKKTYSFFVFTAPSPPAIGRDFVYWRPGILNEGSFGSSARGLPEDSPGNLSGNLHGNLYRFDLKFQDSDRLCSRVRGSVSLPGASQNRIHNHKKQKPKNSNQGSINLKKLQQTAEVLVGTKDFKSLQTGGSGKDKTIKTVYSAKWTNPAPYLYRFDITGSGFLRQMVRNAVGAQLSLLKETAPAEVFKEILKARNRSRAPAPAPGRGLYLLRVFYPPELEKKCRPLL